LAAGAFDRLTEIDSVGIWTLSTPWDQNLAHRNLRSQVTGSGRLGQPNRFKMPMRGNWFHL